LRRFPCRTLQTHNVLFGIHKAINTPWFFSTDGSGRFDLTAVPCTGTCYFAEQPLGAFVEVFRDIGIIAHTDVLARRQTAFSPSIPIRLANCAASKAHQFGITAAIHSTPDYQQTQAWALAFQRAGFEGVRYLLSHDPRQKLVGVAIFGSAPFAGTLATAAIPQVVINEAEKRFGIKVRPVP
jgi:hypothetical protein